MFAWAGATASWPMRTDPGGSRGLDDYFTRDFTRNIGAEFMGGNKFGPQRGPWHDHGWRGWWGDEPPFHTPVFVLTHHTRPSFTLGDTTFHFVDADPATVLDQARDAAQGKDVRPPSVLAKVALDHERSGDHAGAGSIRAPSAGCRGRGVHRSPCRSAQCYWRWHWPSVRAWRRRRSWSSTPFRRGRCRCSPRMPGS